MFERTTPSSPKRFEDMHRDPFSTHQLRHRSHRGSADHANGTPDSPISQVSNVFKDYASQSFFILLEKRKLKHIFTSLYLFYKKEKLK